MEDAELYKGDNNHFLLVFELPLSWRDTDLVLASDAKMKGSPLRL